MLVTLLAIAVVQPPGPAVAPEVCRVAAALRDPDRVRIWDDCVECFGWPECYWVYASRPAGFAPVGEPSLCLIAAPTPPDGRSLSVPVGPGVATGPRVREVWLSARDRRALAAAIDRFYSCRRLPDPMGPEMIPPPMQK